MELGIQKKAAEAAPIAKSCNKGTNNFSKNNSKVKKNYIKDGELDVPADTDVQNLSDAELLEIQKQTEECTAAPVDGLIIKPMAKCLKDARELPALKPIIPGMVNEQEVCLLAGAQGLGKTAWMMQQSIEIAKNYRLAYLDGEMSERQLLMRYPHMEFPPHFFRIEKDRYARNSGDILNLLAQAVFQNDIQVLVIDNITSLSQDLEKASDAGTLIDRLNDIKKRYGLTLIVLCHVPQMYNGYQPMTINMVQGSARLTQLAESVIGLGRSARDKNQVYCKVLKYRNGVSEYDEDNCIVYQRTTDNNGNFVLEEIKHDTEEHILNVRTKEEKNALINRVQELAKQGMSVRQIGKELGISPTTVSRYNNSSN